MIEQPNLKYVDDLAGDDVAFRQQFITILKEEFPKERETYIDHVENKRTKETAAIVHKLKHKFNILGMEEAYRLAVTYEKELLEGQITADAKFKMILDTIAGYIKNI
ncbi:Hpt domain-containing protein [Maribacter sp. MMG018]|uniref:Hpt domain-containing protein n=1 Tax=Maribacter sp. MMG018 TaxID=2822688 RepID=UPI001B38857A|nr:Hpt domain-containing protein [Maribacter sp. MMG018]MBQ4914664.1 Hpt domain-containing protein [Maribacter sp. MMG018]